MTFVRPEYRHNKGALKRAVDGIEFLSYRTGIASYARISADGRMLVRENYGQATYRAMIELANGTQVPIMNAAGNAKRFRSQKAAMNAAIEELAKAERRHG